MKKVVFIVCILSSLAFTTQVLVKNGTSVIVSSTSELYIKGKTNVNHFKCEFNIKELNKPIPVRYKMLDGKMIFEKAKLVLNTDCFDCGNRGMNKDFRALLKSDIYPEILMELKQIDRVSPSVVKANVELSIAGTSRSYYLPLELKEGQDIQVTGTLKLNITDFGLEAPTKALGLIVVSEEIEIKLDLAFEECKE